MNLPTTTIVVENERPIEQLTSVDTATVSSSPHTLKAILSFSLIFYSAIALVLILGWIIC